MNIEKVHREEMKKEFQEFLDNNSDVFDDEFVKANRSVLYLTFICGQNAGLIYARRQR